MKIFKKVLPLFLAQIFGMAGLIIALFIGGIVGLQLTTVPSFSTLPVAVAIVGAAIFAIPSAMIMQKFGRKKGNIFAACLACVGALTAAFSIYIHHFFLFCFATFLIGINSAFVMQYRFAVIEGLNPAWTSRAVSFLLFANIISAYLATELANYSRDWFPFPYLGSFVVLSILLFISIISLFFYREQTNVEKNIFVSEKNKKLTPKIISGNLIPSILIASGSYFIMSLVMVATPLSMHTQHDFSMDKTTLVMQSHLIAMYFPSLFVGFLANRYGNLWVIILGIACLAASLAFNISGIAFYHYFIGLTLLGVGWNFSFIAATTVLTESYIYEHRFKMQAINDFFVFGVNAVASLCSGALVVLIGWTALNTAAIFPLLIIIAASIVIFKNNRKV